MHALTPERQHSLTGRRIILVPINGLPRQFRRFGDLSNAAGLRQHLAHYLELLAVETRLAPKVGPVVRLLGMMSALPAPYAQRAA
jgi:hypothetical protein